MSDDRMQESALLRDFLDGSLPPDHRAKAERLLEQDPDAATLLNDQDKLETFVNRVREAVAMSSFPQEQNDELGDKVRKAVLEQVQSPAAGDTASIGLGDPSVSTDSQAADASTASLTFLSPAQVPGEIGRLDGYRILRQLGHGGMGLVFEAEDTRLKRRVALKVMKPEVAAKEQHRQRFLREAQTAAQVEHDHICPIYQVGEDNGVPFIAMPFLKGEPLDVLLKRQRMPVDEVIRIAREVAEGLAVAHDAGLVHRDIKPANIWLEAITGKRSRVRILDFGLARLQTDDAHITASGAILGTPAYMAPEQARGKPVDRRADLFSLGVVLYEMSTGRRPFTGGDTMSVLTSLAVDDPTPPNLINFEVPAELSDLTMKLLSKSPDKRPANAHVVSETLTAILLQTTRPIVEALPTDSGERRNEFNFDDPTNVDVPLARPAEPEAPAKEKHNPKRQRGRAGSLIALALALLVLLGGSFGAYKLFFEAKDGTLIVEVNDKDAELRFKNGELQVLDADGKTVKYTLKASERNKTLPPGDYLVRVTNADGVELDTKEFTLKKGGQRTIRVTAKGPAVAKAGPGGKAIPGGNNFTADQRKALEWVLSVGGSISQITDDGQQHWAKPGDRLLDRPFSVFLIELPATIDDAAIEHLRAVPPPGNLSLRLSKITDAGLEKLVNFPGLKETGSLDICGTRATDAGLVHLKQLPKLYILKVGSATITDAGLPHLADLNGLRNLDLYSAAITDAGADRLNRMRWLESLTLSDTGFTDAGLAKLRDLTGLHAIYLDGLPITDGGLESLKAMKELGLLSLQRTGITDAGVSRLSELRRLTDLRIAKTKVTAAGVKKLATALPQCKIEWDGGVIEPKSSPDRKAAEWVLSVGGQVGTDGQKKLIDKVADLPKGTFQLTTVWFHDNQKLSDAGLSRLKDCRQLTTLHFTGSKIEDAWLRHFQDSENLTLIDLGFTAVGNSGIAHFRKCKKLTGVCLTSTKVDDVALDHLVDCRELTGLVLDGTTVTNQGLKRLVSWPGLTTLDLRHTKVTDAGLSELKQCPKLRQVLLEDTGVSDKGLEHLAVLSKLTYLSLKKTKVSESGIKKLAVGLPNCRIEWDGGVIEPRK